MTDTFILSRIYETLTFQVGPYRIPKTLLPKKSGPLLDLQASRIAQLVRGKVNPNNQGFEIFLDQNPDLPKCVRELPIIPPPESQRNFYLLDYFFPSLGLAIELDSKAYHQKTKDLEKTNDLKLLGIDTLRLYGFWDPVQRKDLSDNIKEILISRKRRNIDFPIDCTKRLLKDFRIIHREALKILESKPMSGVDQNLYILSEEEVGVCKDTMEILGL